MRAVGFTHLLRKHVQRAGQDCPTLQGKRISPHVFARRRHAHVPSDGRSPEGLAGSGHADMQATEVYVLADPTEKLDALGAVIPPSLRRGQFTEPDRLIAMLHGQ